MAYRQVWRFQEQKPGHGLLPVEPTAPASLVWGPREQPPQTPSAKSKLRGALAQRERGLAQPQWGWLLGAPSSAPHPATPDWQRMERGQPGGLCSDATCV